METESGQGATSMEQRLSDLERRLADAQRQIDTLKKDSSVCIVCFSGEWDRLFAAFTIANGALSLGQDVHMFFTFWAVAALRAPEKEDAAGKSFVQSMLGMMLPSGPHQAPLSKMNFMGLGKSMLKGLMDKKGVPDIDVLMKDAKELGAHLYLCETSSDLFGLKCEELAGGESLERCGVATFLSKALKSKVALFI